MSRCSVSPVLYPATIKVLSSALNQYRSAFETVQEYGDFLPLSLQAIGESTRRELDGIPHPHNPLRDYEDLPPLEMLPDFIAHIRTLRESYDQLAGFVEMLEQIGQACQAELDAQPAPESEAA